jgi:hypothetical protein
MFAHMLSILCSFTGGSYRPNPPRRSRPSLAGHSSLQYDPEHGVYVQDTVRRHRAKDAARRERDEEAKRQRFESLTTIAGLSKDEFCDMRQRINYALPRTTRSTHFHHREKELIMFEKYGILKKNKVSPQHVMDMEHLSGNNYFHMALMICERLGLVPLMKIQQD